MYSGYLTSCCSITSFTWAIDFVPVQTKFPDEKTRTADFGCLILKTSPGNCSGLYSVFGIVFANFVKGTSFPKEVVATLPGGQEKVIYKNGHFLV